VNELVLVLNVYDNDDRSPLVQGQEEIPVSEVLRKRDIFLSHRVYETKVGDCNIKSDTYHTQLYPRSFAALSKKEQENEVFHNARLVCRNAHVLKHREDGRFYEGEARLLYRSEGDYSLSRTTSDSTGSSRKTPIAIDEDKEDKVGPQQPPRLKLPRKIPRLDFGDFFCCSGGATQGAKQAGLHPKFGADKDNEALQVFMMNHPGAEIFLMDAHDISLIDDDTKAVMKVDVLHLSPPCRYWSPAQ
jgi:DNA (cytosine-5)-methyltransferase 1